MFKFMKTTKKAAPKKAAPKKKAVKKTAKKGKKNAFGGYRIVADEKLAAVIGAGEHTPSEMTKKIWQYIKKHNLSKK